MDSDQYARSEKAKATLKASDWVIARALEASVMGAEWCAWRDTVRRIAETGEGVIPPEPPRGKANPYTQAPVDVPMPDFLKDAVPHEISDLVRENEPHGEAKGRLWKIYVDLQSRIADNGKSMEPATAEQFALHSRLSRHLDWMRGTGAVDVI